jgi:hypothetical protein
VFSSKHELQRSTEEHVPQCQRKAPAGMVFIHDVQRTRRAGEAESRRWYSTMADEYLARRSVSNW